MKYRMLTDEELIPLEEDLKHFLIVNGIDGPEWTRINESAPDQALQLVGLFSDTVLQKVYEKLQFLEFWSVESCMVFHCTADHIDLISLSRKPNSRCDLSSASSIHQALAHSPGELLFFRSTKHYSGNRELEIHTMLTNGCIPSSRDFWMLLEQVV